MLQFNFRFFSFKTIILDVPNIATPFKPSYNILLFMGLICFWEIFVLGIIVP